MSAPPSSSSPNSLRPKASIWDRAIARWVPITTVMAALLVIYTTHPYYRGNQFAPWRPFFTAAFAIWFLLGIFYIKATITKFHQLRYVMRDGGLHLLILVRAFQRGRFLRTLKNRRVRTTVLGIFVKAFFTPLMTSFVSGHASGIAEAWLKHHGLPPFKFTPHATSPWGLGKEWFDHIVARAPDFVPTSKDFAGLTSPSTWTTDDKSWGIQLLYDMVFFTDCAFAMVGYSLESRWLGNKTRSVEPTAFGWAAALCCYPPYNNVLGTYLPLDNGPDIITDTSARLWLRFAIVCLFAIYASATVAFGFKFSNLTNRGIISRGPYRFVRHPAYVCKCSAWWLEHLPTMTPTKAFFLTLLCGVYAIRAWTEERHLSRDPDYLAYKKKVPWVIIPGVY